MKFFLLFMLIAVALADEESENSQEELAKGLARTLQIHQTDSLECVRKTEATREDMNYMETVMEFGDTETTDMKTLKKASCLIVCCFQKAGIMVKGEMQVEELFKFFQKTRMPEEIQIPMRNAVRICKEQVTDTSDECMAGFQFNKCMYHRVKEIDVGERRRLISS